MAPEEAEAAEYVPVPEEQEGAVVAPLQRGRALRLLGAGLLAAAALALVSMLPYPEQAPPGGKPLEGGVAEVLRLYPAPSTVREANELLARLPRHESRGAVLGHIQPHAEALFQDFLRVFGSTAPRRGSRPADPVARQSFDSAEEHDHRFQVFRASLAKVVALNAKAVEPGPAEDRATFGITSLSDWTRAEFKMLFGLQGHRPSASKVKNITGTKEDFAAQWRWDGRARAALNVSRRAASCSVNWVQKYPELFLPRNQGECGSCWAFTAAQEIRAKYVIDGGVDPGELSVEYLVSCDPDVQGKSCSGPDGDRAKGCCGGWPSAAMRWLASAGGLPTKAAYSAAAGNEDPAIPHPCVGDVPLRVTLEGPKTSYSENIMQRELCKEGPLGVAVWTNAKWQYYTGGVLQPKDCKEGVVNHGVQVVGLDVDKQAWIIRNSWGPYWGVSPLPPYEQGNSSGFILLSYGKDTCQIEYEAVRPRGVKNATGKTHGIAPTTTPEPTFDASVCLNTCGFKNDGSCDDGGPDSSFSVCEFGTDCADCGPRVDKNCRNTCSFHDDGECDEPGLCEFGTDCADCGAGTCRDDCAYSFDGVCDEPGICDPGTDCTDCGK